MSSPGYVSLFARSLVKSYAGGPPCAGRLTVSQAFGPVQPGLSYSLGYSRPGIVGARSMIRTASLSLSLHRGRETVMHSARVALRLCFLRAPS
jgi:hypothetical protein